MQNRLFFGKNRLFIEKKPNITIKNVVFNVKKAIFRQNRLLIEKKTHFNGGGFAEG